LVSASGEILLKGYDETRSSAELTTTRINSYLNTPTVESLTVWGYGLWRHTLVTLGGGLWFILFVLLFVVAIVDMVVGLDTVAGLYQILSHHSRENTDNGGIKSKNERVT
jgi:hypothetical protein